MNSSSTSARFNPALIALHWFMFILLIAVYVTMEFSGEFPRGSDARALMKSLHFMLGISVLLLVIIRLFVRLTKGAPPITPAPKPWENLLAKIMHLSLYAFMLLMPIAGWLILNANGKAVPFFGLELPIIISPDKAFGHQVHELHETVGSLGYFLIGLHIVAGLFHHYIKRDNTLLRMSLLKSRS